MKRFFSYVGLFILSVAEGVVLLLPVKVKAVSCSLSDNATNTLNSACVIDGTTFVESGVTSFNGITNGDMRVSGADITVAPGTTMTWSPGKAIIIENGGRIIRGANAVLKQIDPQAWFRQQLGFDTFAAGAAVKVLGQNLQVCTADPCTVTPPAGGGSLVVENSIKFGDGTSQTTAYTGGGETAGQIVFFATSCPSGWTEYTALRGRYPVGNPLNGTLAGTSGTALTNLESRPVGQHTHTVNDPGHSHTMTAYTNGTLSGWNSRAADYRYGASALGTSGATTGITINNSGSVAGTNAPYIQLLACQKS